MHRKATTSLQNTLPALPPDICKSLAKYNSPEAVLFFRLLRCPSMSVLRTLPRLEEQTFKLQHARILGMMPVGAQAEIYKVYLSVKNELDVEL